MPFGAIVIRAGRAGPRFRKASGRKQEEVESLLFVDAPTNLRLLRAYMAIKDQAVRRRFVALIERLAGVDTRE
jgi:hypothetical protein